MKRITICICFICLLDVLHAQQADEKIKSLLHKQDYFTLMEILPSVKDSLQSDALKLTAGFLLHLHFNQPEEMLKDFQTLLTNHKAEINPILSTLFLHESIYWFNEGEYKYVADRLHNYLSYTGNLTADEQASFTYYHLLADLLKDTPKPEIIRPKENVEIPVELEQIAGGCLIKISANINGNNSDFMLDTGSPYNYVSESFALKNNIRILPDSIVVYGVNKTIGKIGVTDSLQIGNIVLQNPFFFVVPENNSIHTIDALLGLNFIKMMKEIRIYPQKRRIIFPEQLTTDTIMHPNFFIKNGHLFVEARNNNDRLIFLFDSGHTKANMTPGFYKKRKDWVRIIGTNQQIGIDGVGGRRFAETYMLPFFTVEVDNHACKLTNIPVYTDTTLSFNEMEDGVLGMDFVMQCDEISLNFEKMRLGVK